MCMLRGLCVGGCDTATHKYSMNNGNNNKLLRHLNMPFFNLKSILISNLESMESPQKTSRNSISLINEVHKQR